MPTRSRWPSSPRARSAATPPTCSSLDRGDRQAAADGRVRAGIARAAGELSDDGGGDAADAICTTDAYAEDRQGDRRARRRRGAARRDGEGRGNDPPGHGDHDLRRHDGRSRRRRSSCSACCARGRRLVQPHLGGRQRLDQRLLARARERRERRGCERAATLRRSAGRWSGAAAPRQASGGRRRGCVEDRALRDRRRPRRRRPRPPPARSPRTSSCAARCTAPTRTGDGCWRRSERAARRRPRADRSLDRRLQLVAAGAGLPGARRRRGQPWRPTRSVRIGLRPGRRNRLRVRLGPVARVRPHQLGVLDVTVVLKVGGSPRRGACRAGRAEAAATRGRRRARRRAADQRADARPRPRAPLRRRAPDHGRARRCSASRGAPRRQRRALQRPAGRGPAAARTAGGVVSARRVAELGLVGDPGGADVRQVDEVLACGEVPVVGPLASEPAGTGS